MDIISAEKVVRKLDGYGLTIYDDITEGISDILEGQGRTLETREDVMDFLDELDNFGGIILEDPDDAADQFEALHELPVVIE